MGQSSIKLYVPLNIQRFAMSLGSNAWENQNQGNNSSSIGWSLSATTTGGTYDNTGRSYYRVYTDNYDTGNVSFKISKTTTLNFSGTTQEYGHADDGSLGPKTVHFILYDNANNKTYTNDITVYFTTYPRYANITSFNVSKRDEGSLTVDFGVDATIDYCQYSLNGGEWQLTGVGADSRQFAIYSLSPNTNYNVRIRVKRADSQLWTESGQVSQTTYDYPHITNTPSFIIGNAMYMDLYNPLCRTCTCTMYGNDNSVIWSTTGWTGTSVGPNNSAQDIENLYQSISNSASGTYKMRVVYGSSTRDKTGNTYSVNTDTNKPDFNLFTYADINPTTLALTGDSQKCVIGYSTIQATISTANKATAKNYASMSYYQLEIGTNTPQTSNYSSSEDVTISIANATSNTYKVSAIDSRGLSKPVTLTSASPIQYENITKDISNSSFLRNGGVSEFATLTLSGKIWYGSFGQVNNAIDSVTYRFKKPTDENWTTGTTTITPTVDNQGNFTFEGAIAGNNTDHGFDIDSVYQLEVTISDKLSTTTYSFTLGSGIPQVAYARTGVSIMGKYDDTIGGALQVNGIIRDGVYSETERKVGYWINGKPIYEITIEYSGNLSASGNIEHNIDNIDEVVDYEAKWNGAKLPFVSIVSPTQTTVYINVYRITSAYIQYQVHSSFQTLNNLYVTIWYTKTTDTATITSE